jgi:hypothetical protein
VLSGISIGLAATSLGTGMRLLERTALGALLLTAAYLLPGASGAVAAVFVVFGQVAAAALIGAASAGPGSSRLRAELGVAGGWLLFVLVVLLYQIHFDQPLPFDNRWVVTFGAAVALLAVDRRRRRPGTAAARTRGHRSLAAVGVTAVAVLAVGLASTGGTGTPAAVPGRPLRVVEWNIRQAVSRDGTLAPDAIASVLRRGSPPDVVVLPETARGWPLSGDIDLASWLPRQLGVPYRWAPAADRQFGTLLLTRLPILGSGVIRLPVAGRSQGRPSPARPPAW